MRTGYALRPVSLYNTVHTDSFTATIIIIMYRLYSAMLLKDPAALYNKNDINIKSIE